jgi:hypothetical protein
VLVCWFTSRNANTTVNSKENPLPLSILGSKIVFRFFSIQLSYGQKSFIVFNIILIGVTMFALLSLPAPPLPYGYLWEILFATILAVSLVLAIKYPSFGKRWIFLLFVVGVVEFEFSHNTPPPYNILAVGLVIGLVTAFSGFIIPVLYWAKLHLRKKQVKISFILSGCLELILGSVGIFYRIFVGFDPTILYFGLLTIGFYSLIVGIASLFFAKPKKQ